MPFPKVEQCILCDSIREEVRQKISILGFLGICPNAGVRVQHLDRPVAITFLFLAGFGDGDHSISFEVADGTGDKIIARAKGPGISVDPASRANVVAQLPLTFDNAGVFEIRLLVDERVAFVGRFKVDAADAT
jgi:hypothetical protein